ncbi:alginate O-acetyltransferase AlgF [Bordetella avium]|uniref:Alginate biosynthesis protein AlgF n=1 Tax=Bordetella avium (strain 197N) TaxID=360910 RepID=Q2KWS0_BORA1|nr:alginate O-acetyltransferase AlgF [Bordetella avium]AZY49967.1 cell division protein FtsQ [Bordetella avium]AZY53333.1 cell division protein FtsQ [Bordetella avium]RIQ13074.1 cell division protein FtsQ [Bordetella avium]RIQ17324.1 cell division protein FtsQ [Bordetella avium]RIQ33809.1 cell division protein FtsQ [Bordetella avium]
MTRSPFFLRPLLALLLAGGVQAAGAAQIQLYESGPAEDAAFLRFVNGGDAVMDVSAKGSKARLTLDAAHPASDFMPVRAKTNVQGTLSSGGKQANVDVAVQPGEFLTVVGLPDGAKLVREQPDDFNALKVSLGFYNLDPSCADAGLLAAGRNVAIFEQVAQGGAARRQVNPVALQVVASCGGQPSGKALDLGVLQAGDRHTVLLLPSAKGPRLLHAPDKTSF